MAGPSPVPGPVAQQAAVHELRKAEYHRDDPGVVSRVLSWLGRRVGELFSGSVGGSAFLILILLMAVIVVLAVARAGPLRRSATLDADPLAPASDVDHRARARQLAASGGYAEAVREWLRDAVHTIEVRGVLEPRPGRTSAGVAREAGARLPLAADALREATNVFDAVWFGGRAATPADVASAEQAAEAVRTAAVAGARPAGFVIPA